MKAKNTSQKRYSNNRNIPTSILIQGLILIIILLPLINALTGNYSTTSPFSCGAVCNGGYELSGHNETYCYNNPVECYNTVDDCRDGSNDGFEFVNDITITDLNNTNFTGRDRINITVEFDCDTDGDTITISYNNGSGFRAMEDDTCDSPTMTNKTYTFLIDDVVGNHTVRAVIVYNGGVQMPCGYNYDTTFSDTDDVTFYVQSGPDIANPKVFNLTPSTGASYNQTYGLEIPISADITDNENISSVQALVEWDSYNQTVSFALTSGNNYSGNFTNTTELARYNVTIIAKDTSDNSNNTETTYFTVNSTVNITILEPSQRQTLAYGNINLVYDIQNGFDTNTTYYSIDGGAATPVSNKGYVGFAQSDQNGTRGEADKDYDNLSMSFNATKNMSVSIVSLSLKRNGSGTNTSQLQVRTDNAGSPSSTILGYANITNTSVSTNYSFINLTLNTTVNLTQNITYWLYLTPNGSSTDFYTWQSNDDNLYAGGNCNHNNSVDLLFKVYDKYRYNTSISGLTKGTHQVKVYANNSAGITINSQLKEFYIDNINPRFHNIDYSPTSSADTDPNTTINVSVNVSDNLELSQVLLQYKQANETSYSNNTMTNSSGVYTGNFTPDNANNWTFRIYAVDTSNNSNWSANYTVNASYEYGWNRQPATFNTTSGFLNTNTTIGNITINNTADITLTFNVSKTSITIPSVYFNNSANSIEFNISPGNSQKVEIIVTGQSIESSQFIEINISPSQSLANPDSKTINFTFISYVSGPYLNVEILSYDSTVDQGQKRVEHTARITNVGNESATNISAYWSFPSGWTPKTNATYNTSSLSTGQQVSFTRYIDIDSDASTGSKTINITVNCSEGKGDIDQRNVTVNSTGGGEEVINLVSGGGGGGGAITSPKITRLEIFFASQAGLAKEADKPESSHTIYTTEIRRGYNKTITGFLRNTGETRLINMSLELAGYPTMHYRIRPDKIKGIDVNKSEGFSLWLSIPEYYGSGKHEASLIVRALADNAWKEFSRDLAIIVVTEDKEEGLECLEKAETKIEELSSLRMNTARLRENLEEAQRNYNIKNYGDANALCQAILRNAELGIETRKKSDIIKKDYLELQEAGGKTTELKELKELISLVEDALEREDYALASQRAEQAELLLSLKKKEVQQALSYKWGVARKHWKELLTGLVMLLVIGIFAYSSSSLKLVNKRLGMIKQKQESLNDSIKEAQKKYFVKKTLPRRLYQKEIEHYHTSLADIEKKKYQLKLKKLRIISGRRTKDLEKTRQEAEEQIKELQKKYYVHKNLDKQTYLKLKQGFDRITEDVEARIKIKEMKTKKDNQ